jgi:TRAP-type C4-dicarboxylate transport system permease small subunit
MFVEIVERILARVGSLMRIGGCLCLLGMSFLTVADITGRLNRSPIFGSEEIVTFLAVLALGLSLPYAHSHRSHIGVEVFVQLMSTRVRHRLKLLRETLSIFFFAVVTVMMGAYAHDKRLSGEVSMNLGLPEYLLLYALCACFAVGTLTMLVDFAVFLRHGSKS